MYAPLSVAHTLFLLVVCAEPAGVVGEAEARATVDRAITAHGGAKNLSKFKAVTFTLTGKCFAMISTGADYKSVWSVQEPDKFREEADISAVGKKLKVVRVLNGDEGWVQMEITTRTMDRQAVAERKEVIYSNRVARLEGLTSGKFRLASLGESKVAGRTAVGVRVSHPGHRDINLFFDKQTGMLLKSQRRAKDPTGGSKEFIEEILFGDYKQVEGIQSACKLTILRDGKKYAEGVCSNLKSHAKLDDRIFARPEVAASK